MNQRIENTVCKNIREFEPGKDTIYIKKLENGYQYTYLCDFISFKCGIVTGRVDSVSPDYGGSKAVEGDIITARLTKCYLWGKSPNVAEVYKGIGPRCYWFTKEGVIK